MQPEDGPQAETTLLRARDDVWLLDRPAGPTTVVLAGSRGKYLRVPVKAWEFLQELSGAPAGMTVPEARRRHPGLRLAWLAEHGLVDLVPAQGLRSPTALTLALWRRNCVYRLRQSVGGWRDIRQAMERGPVPGGREPVCRPLFFDRVETAARLSFALPGTSRQCTVVALAVADTLRRHGYAGRVAVLGEHDQVFLHAVARVGPHVLDPGMSLPQLREFAPPDPRRGA